MSVKVFRGSPNWPDGIPRNSYIKVESLPAQTVVYTNNRVSGEAAVDLDPGMYHVIIKKYLGRNALGRHSQIRWEERFLHDLTMDEFNVLSAMRPLNATGKMTSDGWAFFCGQPGCDYSCNNTIAMVLHELKHRGISRKDLVEKSDYYLAKNMEKANENPKTEIVDTPEAPKAPRGRPRSYTSDSA